MIRAVMLIECLYICRGIAPPEENVLNWGGYEIVCMVNSISSCILRGGAILGGED